MHRNQPVLIFLFLFPIGDSHFAIVRSFQFTCVLTLCHSSKSVELLLTLEGSEHVVMLFTFVKQLFYHICSCRIKITHVILSIIMLVMFPISLIPTVIFTVYGKTCMNIGSSLDNLIRIDLISFAYLSCLIQDTFWHI